MAFEIYMTRTTRGVDKGKASIDVAGNARFNPHDLAAAGITGQRAVVLTDGDTHRIALRAPRDGEPTATLHRGKTGAGARVNLRGALGAIGCTDISAAKGLYALMLKEDLVIIHVTPPATAPATGKRKKK